MATYSRKKPKQQPAEAQDNKPAGSILQFLKPLGAGSSKAQKAPAPQLAGPSTVAAAKAAPLQPLCPLLPVPVLTKPAFSKPAASKLKNCFGFAADTISDISDEENDGAAVKPRPPRQQQQQGHAKPATNVLAAGLQCQQLEHPGSEDLGGMGDASNAIEESDSEVVFAVPLKLPKVATAPAAAPRPPRQQQQEPAQQAQGQQCKRKRQVILSEEEEEEEEVDRGGAAAGVGGAAGQTPSERVIGPDKGGTGGKLEEEPEETEESEAKDEGEDSEVGGPQRRRRKQAAVAESTSDWTPESDDSDSDGGISPVANQDRIQGKPAAKPAKTAATAAGKPVAPPAVRGGMWKQAVASAAVVAAEGGQKEGADDAFAGAEAAAGGAGAKPKKVVRRKRGKGLAAAELPLTLLAGLVKQQAADHLLCELPPHLCLDGDSGTIGRVAVERGRGGEAALQLDLMGIVYETELAPLAAAVAVVRMKPNGDELVLEQLFPVVLRCQPQQDFIDENAELFRDLEAYDSNRHCAESETEQVMCVNKSRPKGKGKGKAGGGRKKAAPRKTKAGGARKKVPREAKAAAPKSKPKAVASKLRGKVVATSQAQAHSTNSDSDFR